MGLKKQEIKRRVNGYLERMKKGYVENYSLREKGVYQIFAGLNDEGRIEKTPIANVEGRFIDAIAYAVQNNDFKSVWGNWVGRDSSGNGRIKKINVMRLDPDLSLDSLIESLGGK